MNEVQRRDLRELRNAFHDLIRHGPAVSCLLCRSPAHDLLHVQADGPIPREVGADPVAVRIIPGLTDAPPMTAGVFNSDCILFAEARGGERDVLRQQERAVGSK